jgi:hypothetical protein
MGVEEHPGGRQLVRLRWWPKVPRRALGFVCGGALPAAAAAHDRAWVAAAILGCGTLLPVLRSVTQCTAGMATITQAVRRLRGGG